MFNPFDESCICAGNFLPLNRAQKCEIIGVQSLREKSATCTLIVDGYLGQFIVTYCWSSFAYGPHYMIEPDSDWYLDNIYPHIVADRGLDGFKLYQEQLWDHAVVY